MLTKSKPSALLFDWDNTLANTWPVIFAALTRTFEAMGMQPWTYDETMRGKEGIHHSLRDSFPRIFGDRWQEARNIYYEHFRATHLDVIAPLEGAAELLESLTGRGIYLAVVSNKTGAYLREEVAHLGFTEHFQKIIGAGDAKADKPHPDPVYLAMESVEIPLNHDVWFVGDTMTDMECAQNAGIRPVLYGDGIDPAQLATHPYFAETLHHFPTLLALKQALECFT